MANIHKVKRLNIQKKSPKKAEMAGGLSSKVANCNINGRDNKFKIITFETEFTKRSPTQKNVTERIKKFYFYTKYMGQGRGLAGSQKTFPSSALYIYRGQHIVL
jgi:hypothetical protein